MAKQAKKSKAKKIILIVSVALVGIMLITYSVCAGRGGKYVDDDGNYVHVSKKNSYQWVIEHPALEGFGDWIFPFEDGFVASVTKPLSLWYLMPLIEPADTDHVIESVNYMISYADSADEPLYYDYYTEEQMREDPSKEHTGLVFLRGEEDKPFALVVAGGGFINVEVTKEGFPVAEELHQRGYNVFVLRYRIKGDYGNKEISGSELRDNAIADAGVALKYISDHAKELGISMEGYSLWGFSAGGRVAFSLANPDDISLGYTTYGVEAPAAVIGGYPSIPSQLSSQYPPAYVAMCMDDASTPYEQEADRVATMRALGIEVEFITFETGGHGFGDGYGTPEEGWMDGAVQFWERHLQEGGNAQ